MKFFEKLYNKLPHFTQNLLITLYNIRAYRKRYSGHYKELLQQYKDNRTLSFSELKIIQMKKYSKFMKYAIKNSKFYSDLYRDIENPEDIGNIESLPIVTKELIRKNADDIYTIPKSEGIISKTGGTTGKSLVVLYSSEDVQERFAILDYFRNQFDYKLGRKTAWFSGKKLLSKRDLNKNRFWKSDYLYNVRYYSTFHIRNNYLEYYLKNLIEFEPEYMIGFPSTMYEIAKYGIQHNIKFYNSKIKAIFPTAETITDEIRYTLESFFQTKLYNQYASSEGAPFILECSSNNLHLELQSGVFEILDKNNRPSDNGRLVVTSFNSHGTPLIRYDIGDTMAIDNDQYYAKCPCGNNNPLIKNIMGRISDYIYSPENGKINLGNVSNCLKGVNGIVKFQVIQNYKDSLEIYIVQDNSIFSKKDENTFISNLEDRVGQNMAINLNYVNDIEVESSGKYRLIKNNLII